MKTIVLFVISLWIILPAASQNRSWIHLTEDDGLTGNIVRTITKDNNGCLWIGTDNGLSRYNGDKFKNFYKTDGLPSNLVWALAASGEDNIYVGCYLSGLVILKNDSIKNILHTSGKYANSFREFHFSKYHKKLLAGTDFGLYILDDTTLIPVQYEKDTTKKSSILSIVEHKSRIFFNAQGDGTGGFYEVFINNKDLKKSYAKLILKTGRFASAILNDTVYTSDYHTIFAHPLSDIKKFKVYNKLDSQYFIWNMHPSGKNELLLGGFGDGRFRGNIKFYSTVTHKSVENPYKIDAQIVNGLLYDSTFNTRWVASDNGLFGLPLSPIETFEFRDKNIKDIKFKDNVLWVLTPDTIYRFINGKLQPVISKQQVQNLVLSTWNKYYAVQKRKFLELFDVNRTFNMFKFALENDKLFVITPQGSVSVPDLKTYYPLAIGVFKYTPHGIYSALDYNPLRFYPSVKDSFGYIVPKGEKGTIRSVQKIIESKGVYYFASVFYGLFALKNEKVYYLNDKNSVLDNSLNDIEKDAQGNVWCASLNGNLFQIGFTDSLVVKKVLNSKNSGLIGSTCKWLIFNKKFLFVGTNKGINIIHTTKLYSRKPIFEHFFNNYNGHEYITATSPIVDAQDNIFLRTSDRIIKITPQFLASPRLPLEIGDVFINNIKKDISELHNKKKPFSVKTIAFHFYVIKYPTSKNVHYRYRVNGGDWVSGNDISLQSLRAGTYKMELEARDKETNSISKRTVSFTINKPFWRTYWFVSLMVVLIAGFFYFLMKLRMNWLEKIHREKTMLISRNSELKLRSLQLQMNPHFIFNALNSVQSFILTQNMDEAILYLSHLASIIRTNMENASEEYIPLSNEIDFLKKYAEIEKIRFNNRLDVNFVSDVEDTNVMLPPMLIQPIMENSIKHGIRNLRTRGKLNIIFLQTDDQLKVEIKDNGVGRVFTQAKKNINHNSFGLNIINQRLELLNHRNHTDVFRMEIEDLYNENVAAGTKVTLYFQIQKVQSN